MSDDLEVIMEDAGAKQPQGVGEALVYNFFERDPYTRRHRSRSVGDIAIPEIPASVAASVVGVSNGVAGQSTVGNGKIRVTPAEV